MSTDIWQLEQRMADRRRRDRILLVLAAVVIAGLVAGLIVALHGHGSTASRQPRSNGNPPPVATSSSPSASPTSAPTPGSAADMTTMTFEGATLPVSRTSGPYHVDQSLPYGNLASGFAETPLGAALAAVHISARVDPEAGPKVFAPTINRQAVGDGSQFLQQVQQQYQTEAAQRGVTDGGPLASGVRSDFLGYRIDGYSVTDPVTVHVLASEPGTSVMADIPVTVKWAGSDWKLIPPPGGQFSVTRVSSTSGYTPF